MKNLIANSFLLEIFEARHRLESWRIFGHKSTLDQERSYIGQLMFLGEGLDISGNLFWS